MNNNEILPTFSAEQFAAIFAGTIKSIIADETKKHFDKLNERIDALENGGKIFDFDDSDLHEFQRRLNDVEEKIDEIDPIDERLSDIENKLDDIDFDDIESFKGRIDDIESYVGDVDCESLRRDLRIVASDVEDLEDIRDHFIERVKLALISICRISEEEKESDND